MKVIYQCWSCKKEYKAEDIEYKNGVKCECGGYIVSPSGKASMKIDDDMIKAHYQTDGGGKLFEINIDSIACDLQVAREDFEAEIALDEMATKLSEEEKQQEYDEYLEQIKNLELDQEIMAYNFTWGCTMISQKELDSLSEFDGW